MSKKAIFASKNFLLTAANMPQNSPTPEQFIFQLKSHEIFPQIRSALISSEIHKSGALHFHAVLAFHKRKFIYRKDYFDFIFQKPTDIRPARSLKQAATYITKDGLGADAGMPLLSPKKIDPQDQIIDFLLPENRVLTDLQQISSPEINRQLYRDAHKVEKGFIRIQAGHRHQKLAQHPRLLRFDLEKIQAAPNHLQPYAKAILPVLDFLNQNLDPSLRRLKSKNLLLGSTMPNTGKSSLFQTLEKLAPLYRWPTDNGYESGIDKLNQAIVGDEFSLIGQRIDFLKLLFDGHPLTLPIKGSQVQKSDNPVILCAANHSLRDLFHTKYRYPCGCTNLPDHALCQNQTDFCSVPDLAKISYAALATRIHEIEIKAPLFPSELDSWEDQPLWLLGEQFLISCAIPAQNLSSELLSQIPAPDPRKAP